MKFTIKALLVAAVAFAASGSARLHPSECGSYCKYYYGDRRLADVSPTEEKTTAGEATAVSELLGGDDRRLASAEITISASSSTESKALRIDNDTYQEGDDYSTDFDLSYDESATRDEVYINGKVDDVDISQFRNGRSLGSANFTIVRNSEQDSKEVDIDNDSWSETSTDENGVNYTDTGKD